MIAIRNALGLAAVCATLGLAGSAHAQETETTQKTRPNRPLLVTGGAILVASYTPAVIVAATSDRDEDKRLYIPVAGPWLDLGERGGCGPNACGTEAVYKGLLIATGVAHAVGLIAVVAAFVTPEERTTTTRAKTTTTPVVAPAMMGVGGYGLSMAGRF